MYEYKGISASNIDIFNRQLNELIKLDWEPVGSMSSSGHYGNHHSLLLRRKIKKIKES